MELPFAAKVKPMFINSCKKALYKSKFYDLATREFLQREIMLKSSKFIGAILAVAGLLCLLYPIAASVYVDIVVGISLFVGAFFGLFQCPQCKSGRDKALYFALAVLYAAAGFFMVAHPLEGTVALSLAIGAIFVVQGLFTFAYAAKARKSAMLIFNAIVTLILGILILSNIAGALWIIGMLVGVNLLFTGVSIFTLKTPNEV